MRATHPLFLLTLALTLAACGGPSVVYTTEVEVVSATTLPAEPTDPAWLRAPAHRAELIPQDLVEPRLLEPSTPSLEVRAITDGAKVAFHLRWADPSYDDLPGASRFADACAVQLPRGSEPDVPAPQMGETGRLVEITFWRASWQAAVDGRPDTIQALYPNASVDHYPFEAPSLEPGSEIQQRLEAQYAPARALGHSMEGPRDRAVEDLLAEGPGTLTRSAEQRSTGTGRRTEQGWEVVIVRPLPTGLAPGRRSQIAFAVWDGAHDEVGARKMRSGWVALSMGSAS